MGLDRAMSCEAVQEELVALLDHELEQGAADELRAHLGTCPECQADLRATEQARSALSGALASREVATGDVEALWAELERPAGLSRRSNAPRRGRVWRAGRSRARLATMAAAGIAGLGLYLVLGASGPSVESERRAAARAPAESAPMGGQAQAVARAPAELRTRPDMFVDFVIVRRLDKLDQLPELLGHAAPAVGAIGST